MSFIPAARFIIRSLSLIKSSIVIKSRVVIESGVLRRINDDGVFARNVSPKRLLACLLVAALLSAVTVSLPATKASGEEANQPNQPAAIAATDSLPSLGVSAEGNDVHAAAKKEASNAGNGEDSWLSVVQSFFGSLFGLNNATPKAEANAATVAASAAAASTTMFSTTTTASDFDGDGKADIAVYNPETAVWTIRFYSGAIVSQQWGQRGNQPAPADYDADNRTDYAVFNPATGVWSIKNSNGGELHQPWGTSGDLAVAADYDGDRRDDIAIYRPSNGCWYILQSSTNQMYGVQFGSPEDIPVAGDYDADGRADIAVWRPSTGMWYGLYSSSGGFFAQQWGIAEDIPVPADYDGDNRTDVAVWRPSSGYWYVIASSSGAVLAAQFGWGVSPYFDVPVPADYDGDRRADYAVWRRADTNWFILYSFDGSWLQSPFGQSGDVPVSSAPNKRPIANAGGAYNATVGAAVTLNGTQSSDSDGSILSYTWNFRDSTAPGYGATVSHVYTAAGTYTVTLTVADNRGAQSASSTTVTVSGATPNTPPVARPGGPYSGTAGAAVQFNGSNSSDPDGSIAAYSWNFGDGTGANVANPAKAYTSAGSYTVSLTVTDNRGATHTATTTATISAAPTPTPVPNQAPRLAKEYIYGGSKLIATEEPATP